MLNLRRFVICDVEAYLIIRLRVHVNPLREVHGFNVRVDGRREGMFGTQNDVLVDVLDVDQESTDKDCRRATLQVSGVVRGCIWTSARFCEGRHVVHWVEVGAGNLQII